MKKLMTVTLVLLLMSAFVPQAFAGPPEEYTIEFLLAPSMPTAGVADPAYICPVDADPCDGTSALDVGRVESSWVFRPGFPEFSTVHGQHTFTSADGSWFTVRFQAHIDTKGEEFAFLENWAVAEGSGRYERMQGSGHGRVVVHQGGHSVNATLTAVHAEL